MKRRRLSAGAAVSAFFNCCRLPCPAIAWHQRTRRQANSHLCPKGDQVAGSYSNNPLLLLLPQPSLSFRCIPAQHWGSTDCRKWRKWQHLPSCVRWGKSFCPHSSWTRDYISRCWLVSVYRVWATVAFHIAPDVSSHQP